MNSNVGGSSGLGGHCGWPWQAGGGRREKRGGVTMT